MMAMEYKGRKLTLPLSDETRAWLLSRGQDVLVHRLDQQWEDQRANEPVTHEVITQDNDEDEEIPPYWEWSKSELVEELKARGLDTSGRKEELVARLEEDDASGEA